MDSYHERQELPRDRARLRARSMLSTFKNPREEQDGVEVKHDYLPSEHTDEGTIHDVEKDAAGALASATGLDGGQVDSMSPFPALDIGSLPAPSEPIDIKRSDVLSVNGFSYTGRPTDSGSDSDDSIPDIANSRGDLRRWCTGQPPKTSFLGSDGRGRIPFTRRSTLAEKPELDILLATTTIMRNGRMFLPLSAQTIHRLSPYWKGEKPVADTKIFERIMMTQEINSIHADHVVAALERIGGHCKHLLVVSPIQTSELGNVSNREAGDFAVGNDWEVILNCFPNLQRLAFVHPIDESVVLSRGTLNALHTAIANRQAAQELKMFSYSVPPRLLTNLFYMNPALNAAAVSVN